MAGKINDEVPLATSRVPGRSVGSPEVIRSVAGVISPPGYRTNYHTELVDLGMSTETPTDTYDTYMSCVYILQTDQHPVNVMYIHSTGFLMAEL